jgi:NAD(P)-dependent dehydrogenase (short-subunit alcohol dehydrogenase family)
MEAAPDQVRRPGGVLVSDRGPAGLAPHHTAQPELAHEPFDGAPGHLDTSTVERQPSLSSSAHLFSPVVFDDINFRFRPYDATLAYAQSRTAVNLFAVAATARWRNDGITMNAVNPGAIATPLQRHVGGKLATPVELQKTTEQGASTSVLLAVAAQLEGIGGRYFNDNQEAVPTDQRPADVEELVRSVAPYSLDPENAQRVWAISAAAVGLKEK